MRAAALIIFLSIISSPALVFPTTTKGVLESLEEKYNLIEDMTAKFEQVSTIGGFGEKRFKGVLYIKKPGMARWDYKKPEKQYAYIKDKRVILYLPYEKQVIIRRDSSRGSEIGSAISLLSDIGKWKEMFDVTDMENSDGLLKITLSPKSGDMAEEVMVEINKKTLFIEGLTILEPDGNRVHFKFFDIKVNKGLKNDLFLFSPPEGVEVLEY